MVTFLFRGSLAQTAILLLSCPLSEDDKTRKALLPEDTPPSGDPLFLLSPPVRPENAS
ncbi:hypothetical protein LZ32DRAFT_606975 [Colletotrichum eremochloae]|nr:hypothetical protein LZ32DRAFT_606975 [Colletotrichum eremochloae]